MANITVLDLQAAGSGLFLDSESFIDSMQDLSEHELKMTFGGKGGSGSKKSGSKKSGSKKSGSKKSGSKYSSSGSCGCGCYC